MGNFTALSLVLLSIKCCLLAQGYKEIQKATHPTFRISPCTFSTILSKYNFQLFPLSLNVIPRRATGWWVPPGRFDGDSSGDDGDSYMYRIRLETGQNYRYEVTVEDRDVVLRGEVHDVSSNRRYEHKFVKRHRLPDDVDLSTVQTTFKGRDLIITAKYKT